MIYYHSAIYHHAKQDFDLYPWHKLKDTGFCHLIPFDVVLTTKCRVSGKKEGQLIDFLERQREALPDVRMMLDCGAFTAYRQGFEIDVHEFCDFIERHKDLWESIVALDKINNPEGTWENFQIMKDRGIKNIMPVYHTGEPDDVLVKYCENSDYVGFSPTIGLDGPTAVDIYQAQLYNEDGSIRFPNTKFHGFGVGTPIFFQAYPWYSCDSSNSSLYGRYGSVFVFEQSGSIVKMKNLFVSSRQYKNNKHYTHLPDLSKQEADKLFAGFGFKKEDFDENFMDEDFEQKTPLTHANRVLYNVRASDDLVRRINEGEIRLIPPPVRLI